MTVRKTANVVLSVVLGLGFLWLTFRGVDLDDLMGAFRNVSWWYLALYLVFLTAIQLVRTTRWAVMLEPIRKVPFRTVYAVSSVGFMALVLLPFRLGEFARPFLIKEKAGISITAATATVVVERILDAITISVILFVTLLVLAKSGFQVPGWLVNSGVVFFLVFFALLLVCVYMYKRPDHIEKICHAVLGWISKGLQDKAVSLSNKFIGGLRIFPDWRRVANIVLQSLLYWCINASGLYVMFVACGIREAGTGAVPPYVAAYVLLCMQVVGISIPSGPAFTGPFDYFTAITVAMFAGLPHSAPQVQVYVILVHGMQLLQQSLFGLVYVLSGYVSFSSLLKGTSLHEFDDPT
ncbi:MAG: flippase-like domain-containing protein [Deltaproteobacteria bacterium]|nr:flippase-like domain-containing protein [Deltaproteobacteria bacterium]